MADAADYRSSHVGVGKAAEYDADFWRTESTKGINWQLEQKLLDQVFRSHFAHQLVRGVDFACGTGRVLQYLQKHVAEAIGIDISDDMLKVAKGRCGQARLISTDVTETPPAELAANVDVVTSFRFLLNAEPALRREVLDWIRFALHPRGLLVVNFHLNPHSMRGSYLRLRRSPEKIPMLTPAQATRLLSDAGFRVVDCLGYEYLPYRREGTNLFAPRLRSRIETNLLSRRRFTPAAGAFIVVAQPV